MLTDSVFQPSNHGPPAPLRPAHIAHPPSSPRRSSQYLTPVPSDPIPQANTPPQITLYFLLGFSSADYTRILPLSTIQSAKWQPSTDELAQMLVDSAQRDTFARPEPVPARRANATLVMLVRNREVNDAVNSMRQMEDRFNRKFRYPWVFLNDEPFTAEFRRCVFFWCWRWLDDVAFLLTLASELGGRSL